MDDAKFEVIFEDEDNIRRKISTAANTRRRRAKDLIENIGQFGEKILMAQAPRDEGYILRHIGRDPVTFYPGGPGGGGEYRSVFGVKAGTSKHPLYAEFGTGIYGAVGWYITPRTQPFMTFYGDRAGRILHKKFVKGQKPQHYFYFTWLEVQFYAGVRALAEGKRIF